jgi:Winged helix DNA-binding domain
VTTGAERLTLRECNRALMARQGLSERLAVPLVEGVETVGALQAQHWPALPVALWSRIQGFAAEHLHGALASGELVSGTLLRATLHLVSARQHPAYAAVVAAAGNDDWRRTDAQPSAEVADLRGELLAYTRPAPRSGEQLAAFIEQWVAHHPGAIGPEELASQRAHKWRAFLRWSAFVREPVDGNWGARAPTALRAAPCLRDSSGSRAVTSHAGDACSPDAALETVVRRHLRAFGPAGAQDVASWIGWRVPPVRAALQRLGSELTHFEDEDGRPLHDLPDAPRPHPETPVAPRLLAAFDSVLLAYAVGRRARILPDAYRDAVYERANLRIRPTFLIDGLVAGTWSVEVRRREAVLTLRPLQRLPRAERAALVAEAERLVGFLHPGAATRGALVEG